jgi:hypothetical protein
MNTVATKNRRKTLRKIVVNNETYMWRIKEDDWNLYLQIWKNKLKISEEYISDSEITPKIVKEKILNL